MRLSINHTQTANHRLGPFLLQTWSNFWITASSTAHLYQSGRRRKEWMHEFIQSLPVRFHKIFLFTWHVNRCTYTVRRTGLMKTRMFILKRLSKVWKKKWAQKAAMNRHNTIIVEDTPSNCLDNYGNAIYVPAYRWCVEQEDTILPRLQTYLTDLATKKSVRSIEKRGWISE